MNDNKPLEQIIKETEGYNKDKVSLVFKAVPPAQQIGNIKLPREHTIGSLIAFLKKKYPSFSEDNSSLILYCGHDFALSPSAIIGDIYDNFAGKDSLVISYSIVEAWG